jgi:hypothetical protein
MCKQSISIIIIVRISEYPRVCLAGQASLREWRGITSKEIRTHISKMHERRRKLDYSKKTRYKVEGGKLGTHIFSNSFADNAHYAQGSSFLQHQ